MSCSYHESFRFVNPVFDNISGSIYSFKGSFETGNNPFSIWYFPPPPSPKRCFFLSLPKISIQYYPRGTYYLSLQKPLEGFTISQLVPSYYQCLCFLPLSYGVNLVGTLVTPLLLLFRSQGRMPCPKYEAVEFQPRTVDNPVP